MQEKTWCDYKSRNLIKGLVVTTTTGYIESLELFPGRDSDLDILQKSKFLKELEGRQSSNEILLFADKGFAGFESSNPKIRVIAPMSNKRGSQDFTEEIVKANQALARGRVTVEQFFGRIKKWGLIKDSSSISNNELKYFEKHIRVICYLANKFGKPFQI